MKNQYRPAFEKFSEVVNDMALSQNSMQTRIADAYLKLMWLKNEELPEEIQISFEEISKKLTSSSNVPDESLVHAAVKEMTFDEALKIAKVIVEMSTILELNGH